MNAKQLRSEFITGNDGFQLRVLVPADSEYLEPFWEEQADKCGLMDSSGKKYYADKAVWGQSA